MQIMNKSLLSFMVLLLLGCGPSATEQELEKAVEPLMESEEAHQNFELNGSVFIVTLGQTTYKLALVPVAAVSREDYQNIVSNADDMISDFIDDNKERYSELIAELTSIKDRNAGIESEVKKETSDLENLVGQYEDREYDDEIEIVSDTIFAYEADRPAATKLLKDINSRIDSINAKIDSFTEDEEDAADQLYEKIKNIVEAANTFEKGFQRALASEIVLNSSSSTKTNADGEFSFNLKRGTDYVIVAHANRSVGDSFEEYNWFVDYKTPLDRAEDTILVSNDNLAPDTSVITDRLSFFQGIHWYNPLSYDRLDKYDLNIMRPKKRNPYE